LSDTGLPGEVPVSTNHNFQKFPIITKLSLILIFTNKSFRAVRWIGRLWILLALPLVARESITLNDGWRLAFDDPADALHADTSSWTSVRVPHNWNVTTGVGSTNQPTNQRGAGWYALRFAAPKLDADGRVFLKFNGASIVADVYLNGTYLGQHRGAFGAFCFEITTNLNRAAENDLRVRVDNRPFSDIPPLAGDFTMFGGLYRPVEILTTQNICITPMDFASPGIALAQNRVTRELAEVAVQVSVSRVIVTEKKAEAIISLNDANGKVKLSERRPVKWQAGVGSADFSLNIVKPHLWNGVKDPYLYSVRVELAADGRVLDSVQQPLGLRSVRVDSNKGFFLNGEPYPIQGVALHQDREGKGWAVNAADELEDMEILRAMGANALRLAHYQHSETFLQLCDRAGLLVWAEIPLVNKVRNTPEFHANAEQQLRELIRQQRNHPSIMMWGLFNELYHQGPTDPCESLVAHLQSVAKQEDSTRLTTAASNQRARTELNKIPDLIACNIYPGWYGEAGPASMGTELKTWLAACPGRGLGVSEYGAGGSLKHHVEWPPQQPDPGGHWHPEEYQSFCHEEQFKQIVANHAVWGGFVWNAFDFASEGRDEGDRAGINDKGLVSNDRRFRKDAFYLYRANWNPEPMVHLNSKRFDLRHQKEIIVRAYSNCDSVELLLNGRSLRIQKPDEMKIAVWPAVVLAEGENQIEVIGRLGFQVVRDKATFRMVPMTTGKLQSQINGVLTAQ
jgi:beta-galactosidase